MAGTLPMFYRYVDPLEKWRHGHPDDPNYPLPDKEPLRRDGAEAESGKESGTESATLGSRRLLLMTASTFHRRQARPVARERGRVGQGVRGVGQSYEGGAVEWRRC